MKTIVNVYKDAGLWRHPPIGLGDFVRGCCYLAHQQLHGPHAGQFNVAFNTDLALGAELIRQPSYPRIAKDDLTNAVECFDTPIDAEIEAFLSSSAETLCLSTNRSWRGIDDRPLEDVIEAVGSTLLKFSDKFEDELRALLPTLPANYTLLHVRDVDRGAPRARLPSIDEARYRYRLRRLLERVVDQNARPASYLCISNNVQLRSALCRRYGFTEMKTNVANTGYLGILSRAELMDAALIRHAAAVKSVSYFDWSSGFALWVARIFGVPAELYNKAHLKNPTLPAAIA